MVRKVREEDAAAFLDLLLRLDYETNYMMYEPGERKTTAEEMNVWIRELEASGSLLLGAVENNSLVGFLSAERGFARRIRHSAYLVIGILEQYRGRGLGTALFGELEKWARESGITRLELTVMVHNVPAVGLYKKAGFIIEGVKRRSLLVDGREVNEYYMAKLL